MFYLLSALYVWKPTVRSVSWRRGWVGWAETENQDTRPSSRAVTRHDNRAWSNTVQNVETPTEEGGKGGGGQGGYYPW